MYVELHALSNFSFLRGASQPEELVEQAKALNYAGLALTDECSLAGVVRAHVAAKEHGLPLIIGTELTCLDKLKVVVLATDRASYGALSRLISKARRAARKGCYSLTRADLENALPGCLVLWLPRIDKAGLARQEQDGRWLRERFAGSLWIGVELTTCGHDARRLEWLETLSKTLQLPCVAAGDVHMHRRNRRALQDVQATPCIPMVSAACVRRSVCASCTPRHCWRKHWRSRSAALSSSMSCVTSIRRRSCLREKLPRAICGR